MHAIAVLSFFVLLFCGGISGSICGEKHLSSGGGFLLGLLLGPLGIAIVLLLPPGAAVLDPATVRQCPQCAETIMAEAVLCRYCHSKVVPTFAPAAPAQEPVDDALDCPSCGRTVSFAGQAAGASVECPHCNAALTVAAT